MKASSASCPCRQLVLAVWWASSLSLASGFSVAPPLILSTMSMSTADGTATSALSSSPTATRTRRPPRVPNLMASRQLEESSSWKVATSKFLLSSLSSFLLLFVPITTTTTTILVQSPEPAYADGSTVVGKLQGSGLVFKDTLQIQRFEDPKIKGVELYISNFDRPITEKLSGANLFNDPAYASVACTKTAKVVAIADNIAKGPGGEEVFEESRSLLFKTLRVQRIYDTETNTVIYVSYNTRLDKNDDTNKSRFKSSLCAVNLNDS